MQRLNNQLWSVALILASGGIVSCGGNTPVSRDVDVDKAEMADEEQAVLVVGDYANLTEEEARDYDIDRRYLRELAPADTPVRLNFADPQQYRLAKARLKIAGKTRTNAPNLFRTLEDTREEHVKLGYAVGSLAPKTQFRAAGDGREAQHFISMASVDGDAGEGGASSSYPDGSYYTMLDVGYYDGSGAPLGAPNIVEQFGGGRDVNVQTDADLTLSSLDSYSVDSFQMESSAAGFGASFIYTDMGLQGVQPFNRPPPPQVSIQVAAPVDHMFGDDLISICLNRVWTQDCDYDLTGNPQSVKVPLQGSFQINSPHVFSENAIDQIKDDLTNDIPNPRAGYVKLLLADAGGGCDVEPDGALESSMEVFWNNTTLSPDAKTLSWDLTGANSAFFDDGCRQVQDDVFLTMRIHLPLHDPVFSLDHWMSKTLTNNPEHFGPDHEYAPIQMTNSCLAEGTTIQMANGEFVDVETISMGDHVHNTFGAGAKGLTVTDTAVGFETEPMVRLSSANGFSVLMTEMHPVQTPDRGIVLARDLKQGDAVVTASGVSTLSVVGREDYDGKVYNLKLGTEAEKASFHAEDQTLVYANGFLVGDGQVQSKYESIAMSAPQGDVLDRIPAEWHLDYERTPLRR